MTQYQIGMLHKLAESPLLGLFGFGDKKKDSPLPEIAGGATGAAAGLGWGHRMARDSQSTYKAIKNVAGRPNQFSGVLKAYSKKMIPVALVTTALGVLLANKMEDR